MFLSCLQIFQAVLGQSEYIVLIRVVLRMSALVRGAVRILHRELTASITDTEYSSLEFGIALLCFPNIQLRNPVNLRIPCSKRIDTESLCHLGITSLLLIANSCPKRRKVEEQAVVVFCPTSSLEGNEFGTVVRFYFLALVDRMV